MDTVKIPEMSLQFADLITPFISLMVVVIIGLLIKDIAGDIAKGISFKFFGSFKEGDKVVLDGHSAIVVKIGMTVTVFGCNDPERGYIWRYVPNDRIGMLSLGKVITHETKEL